MGKRRRKRCIEHAAGTFHSVPAVRYRRAGLMPCSSGAACLALMVVVQTLAGRQNRNGGGGGARRAARQGQGSGT